MFPFGDGQLDFTGGLPNHALNANLPVNLDSESLNSIAMGRCWPSLANQASSGWVTMTPPIQRNRILMRRNSYAIHWINKYIRIDSIQYKIQIVLILFTHITFHKMYKRHWWLTTHTPTQWGVCKNYSKDLVMGKN